MKIFCNSTTFNYTWEEVSTANWRKYCPWNDKCDHVIAVDTLSRHIDPDTGILCTERLITCRQSAPQWLASLMGGNDTSHVYEASYVDPINRKVTMISSNLTYSNIISCHETVTYQPVGAHQTRFQQEAKIVALCGGWQKIKNAVEEATVKRFSENATRGREGFEAVLEMSRRCFREERAREEQARSA